MNRRERQAAILRLVQDRALSTQAELVQALQDEGHDVVQTTVSRDVAELGLVKVRARAAGSSTHRPGQATPIGCARSVPRCDATPSASRRRTAGSSL